MVQMALVSVVIYALLETLITLFLQGSVWISQQIMNSSITVFSTDDNILNSFYKLLPVGFSDGAGQEHFLNLTGIIDGIGTALLVLIITASIIKSLAAPITGENTESPVQVGIRAIMAIFLKVIIFGSSIFSFNGLLGYIGKIFTIAMSYVGEHIEALDPDFTLGDITLTLNPAAYIGMLLLTAALVSAVLGASITYIERILTFLVSLLVGPIAVYMYASKSSSDVTKSWIQSIFAQLGAILISLIMWALFLAQLDLVLNSDGGFIKLGADSAGIKIFRTAVAIAILSLVRNSEKIFNNIGIRTMPNADSARALMGGIAGIGMAFSAAGGARAAAQGAVNKYIHGGKANVARGGASAGAGTGGATTGMSLYNNNGDMCLQNVNKDGDKVTNPGNFIRQHLSRANQGGISAPLFGKDSVQAMQGRQNAAMNHMYNEVKNNQNGASIQGMNAKYGSETKNYSAAQTANMAISGKADGNSRFAFVSSTQNANVNGAAGAGGGSISVGRTNAVDGSTVSGFVGTATHMANGVDAVKGDFFVPTENGKAELAVGQIVNTGDGVEKQITGTKIAIDDFGGYAWEVKPVQDITPTANIDDTINTAVENAFASHFESAHIDKPEIMSEQEIGAANIADGDSYDPN